MSHPAFDKLWDAIPDQQKSDPLDALWDKLPAKPAQPTQSNALVRGLGMLGSGIGHAVMHPIDTAESMVTAPIKSAYEAVVSPGVGEARPDPRLSKGGNPLGASIDRAPYDIEHGAITPAQRRDALAQTLANVAAPAAIGGIGRALAPAIGKTLATGAGLATAGAGEGAAYNPNDRAAGAIAGAIGTPLIGGLTGGAVKGGDAVADALRLRSRIAKAPTIGAQAVERANTLSDTDARNFGLARAQAAGNETSPGLQSMLNDPDIKPYADMVRNTAQFKNANDGEIAMEADNLMSEDRGGYKKAMSREPSAELRLKDRNLAAAQQRLRTAISTPSEKPPLYLDVSGSHVETPYQPPLTMDVPGTHVETPNKSPLYLDVAEQQHETEPLIESARQRLLGPTPRTSVEPPGAETIAQRSAREALQRRSGLAAALRAGPIEGQAVSEAGQRPVVRPPAEQPTPEFVLPERQERILRPGVSVTTPAMRVQTAPGQPGMELNASPMRVQTAPAKPGMEFNASPMRIQTAPAEQVGPVASAFPAAKAASSELRGQTKTFDDGYQDGLRLLGGQTPKNVRTAAKTSPEAISQKIQTMNPNDAEQYLQGVLAAGKTAKSAPLTSAHTLYNALVQQARPMIQRKKLSPFVNALDVQRGVQPPLPTDLSTIMQSLGLLNASNPTP